MQFSDWRPGSTSKVIVFLVCLVPFFWVLWISLTNQLGPDPVKELALLTGLWAFRFLLLTLAVTPIRQLTEIPGISRFRRMLGLYSLWYASLHFLVWLVLLLELRWGSISQELIERPYITVGSGALFILVALGATSTQAMMRMLGKNWRRLHRFVYLAGILVLIHMVWIQRSDLRSAVAYGTVLAALLGYRLFRRRFV